ncbi:MAG: type II secretion system F family protein [Thermodesulfobacteriota bacterium]
MPVYSYRALDNSGKMIKGVAQADDARQARARLRAEGLHPVDIQADSGEPIRVDDRPEKSSSRTGRLRTVLAWRPRRSSLLADATRQLATLLSAGLPLVTALATIQEQAEDQEFGRRLALVREEVIRGESLTAALAGQPDLFPSEYVHLIRAGEMSGALDLVLTRLAENLEIQVARRAKVQAALAYPAFMTLVGLGVLTFLLTFIIPTLTGLFENLGAGLPWPTRLLLASSALFRSYWWAWLLLLAGAGFGLKRLLGRVNNYRRLERAAFRLPVFGRLWLKLKLAQAFRGLAVMTGGGVALSAALAVTAQGLGRSSLAELLTQAAEKVAQGRSLSEGLSGGLFPPLARRMIAVGEASGTLPEMLGRVAKAYEEETDRTLAALTSLVEPIIILVMGLLVGFVVLAVLLPIFDLSGLVK